MTRRVALIGSPLRRRHSQVMHDAAFAANGMDTRYELFDLERDELPRFVEQARDSRWYGFQITAPYKRVIMDLLDEVEPQASAIGAVNSVYRREEDGALVGFNTDAQGFAAAVRTDLDVGFRGTSVVIAGAGGAARAVAWAALDGGANRVQIVARQLDRATELVVELSNATATSGYATSLSAASLDEPNLAQTLGNADLLVNATTVGMLESGSVVDPSSLGERAAVFDLVYIPPQTELVLRARTRGLRATNGAEMLVAQAAIAFERWTGIPGMNSVMRDAVAPLIAEGGAP